MATKPVLVLSLVALSLLAGCSDSPPSGDLPAGSPGLAIDGNVVAEYTPASSGGNPLPPPANCLQDNSPVPPPAGATPCVPASSSFKVHFMALPTPDASGYHVFLTGAAARDLGALMANEANMWELTANLTEDVSAGVTGVELRMGSFVIATASGAEGTNTFAVAEGLGAVSATGTYKGKDLTVTVSGLPANGTYMGRLYTLDEESGILAPGEFFPITPDTATEFRAELNIGDYSEFHVHVGTSAVNLYKATIPQ